MNRTPPEIAIVGFAARLPGADDADAVWRVLCEGRCTITRLPEDRFGLDRYGHPDPSAPGKAYTWAAGVLQDVFGFDPAFFGISPREAVQMDPQQRLLLEVAWQALEHAGIPPSALAGTQTGVYVGASALDYSNHIHYDPAVTDTSTMTGNTLSIVANRLSYVFDLKGPSFTVDTACSSSLVAFHQAAEDLRRGRIDTAIVGGVNVLLHPAPFIGFSRASMLSPSGLCRAFDAAGDGYVRSEGAAVFVLRRRDVAEAAGDVLHALVAGSAVNADGRTVGLSLPASDAQARLLGSLYGEDGLSPEDLAFIEAHGTGTRVGDPAEAGAIGRVLGQRRGAPLPIGSVKTNFGHLEPASGLVGLLKSQLALSNDLLPPSLHFETPNPDIPFADLNVAVAAEPVALARTGRPRLAGVNSFGFGGANAHVVLMDPPAAPPAPAAVPERAPPLVLSAATESALRTLAGAAAEPLAAAGPAERAAFASAAAFRRERLRHRLVLPDATADDAPARLAAVAAGTDAPDAFLGRAVEDAAAPVFVFSGNGAQWAGMGRRVHEADDAFRAAFGRVDAAFRDVTGWSAEAALLDRAGEHDVSRADVAQPLLFAIAVALAEALAGRGLVPGAVVGHSVGEVAAAHVAGALSLEDAVRVIHARSTLQEETRHTGGMLAALCPEADAQTLVAAHPGTALAAVNSQRSVTIAGPTAALEALARAARARRIATKRLDLDYPFHCALVDGVRAPLLAALSDLSPRAATVPFVSTVAGGPLPGEALDAAYWWRNVREPVRFADAVAGLLDGGERLFVEIGPRPVLTGYLQDLAKARSVAVAALPSLETDGDGDRDDTPVRDSRAVALDAFAHGARVDEAAVFGPRLPGLAWLPGYPFERTEHRLPATPERVNMLQPLGHPFLGGRLRDDQTVFYAEIDLARLPFLADHRVEETAVFPAAGFLEILAALGRRLHGEGTALEVSAFEIVQPMVLDESACREVRTTLESDGTARIESRPRLSDEDWLFHARARIRKAAAAPARVPPAVDGARPVEAAAVYREAARLGLPYGPAFRRVLAAFVEGPRVARVALDGPGAEGPFVLDPTLLDAALHGLFALVGEAGLAPEGSAVLPARLGRLVLGGGEAGPIAGARVAVTGASPRVVDADVALLDGAGESVAVLEGLRFQIVALGRDREAPPRLYRTALEPLPRRTAADAPDAAGVLEAAGLLAAEAPDLSDAALLVDIAARVAMREALSRGPFAPGRPAALGELLADGRLSAEGEPVVAALLAALEAAGAASRDDLGRWSLSGADRDPPLADILATLAAEAPERAAELAALAAAPSLLDRAIAAGPFASRRETLGAGIAEHLATGSPAAGALAGTAADAVAALADAWPEAASPFQVLAVGASAPAFLSRLAGLAAGRPMRLAVTDPSDDVLAKARLSAPAGADVAFVRLDEAAALAAPAGFDLVVSAGEASRPDPGMLRTLRDAMAPAGVFLAVEGVPGPFEAMLAAVHAGEAPAADPFARRPRTPREWRAHLAVNGFRALAVSPVASEATEASLVLAAPAPRAEAAGTGAGTDGRSLAVIAAGDRRLAALAGAVAGAAAGAGLRLSGDGSAAEADAAVDGFSTVAGAPAAASDLAVVWGPVPNGPFHSASALAAQFDRLVRLLAADGVAAERVFLVAPGALADGPEANPVQAAVLGFARVACNELPGRTIVVLDAAGFEDPADAAGALLAEIAAPGDEREIRLTPSGRFAPRLAEAVAPAPADPPGGEGGRQAMRLAVATRGSIDSLAFEPVDLPAPGPGEVEIAVEAAGLNFRDVMWTLGLLPADALEEGFAGATLGMECAGRVVATGPGETRFSPGDRVVAFAPAALASRVVVSGAAVMPVPGDMPPAAAATIPVAFLTAWYALDTLANLAPDETVLVHGGAGGVGLAALQIALHKGARVIATAGSPAKRALAATLGAHHVLDSRSQAFADEVRAITGGAGVDVVLNSLAGEAMERSLETLKPFGRFLELGKRDFFSGTRVGLSPFRRNLSYFGIDADQLVGHRPDLARRILERLAALFAEGTLVPLPYRRFPAEGVREAFRLMQTAGHVGKIVVEPPAEPAPRPAAPAGRRTGPDPAGTYLVTGGTGGFGFAAAKFLLAEGAGAVVLASRSGATDPSVAAEIEALSAAGAAIRAVRFDVTDAGAVRALVEAIDRGEKPLRGVLHAAMVLDDGLMANLSPDRFEAVLAPKVTGADVLDAVTADRPLDTFLLFSSVTTAIGNPGQANYVAANAYLEGLARRRRAAGRPALAVAFGAIADLGVVARGEDRDLLKAKLGRHAMTADEALGGLKRLLDAGAMTDGDAAVTLARVDWAAARRELALLATPLYARLAAGWSEAPDEAAGGDLAALLAGLDDAAAVAHVSDLLAREISRILKLPAAEIELHMPLARLGMDSLMAVELRMAAESRLGIEIPLMSLAGGATVADIARKVVARVRGVAAPDVLDGLAGQIAKGHVADAGDEADPELISAALEAIEQRTRGEGRAP